jgi:hypothetical protein
VQVVLAAALISVHPGHSQGVQGVLVAWVRIRGSPGVQVLIFHSGSASVFYVALVLLTTV